MQEKIQEQQKTFKYRRVPAVPRRISEIVPEKDIRVRILGRVIDIRNGSFVIDDGTSTAEIISENVESAKHGSMVRVFCRVIPLETGYELRAEIIQDMSGLDMDLYKKVF